MKETMMERSARIRSGEISVHEAVEQALGALADDPYHVFITMTGREELATRAEEVQRGIREGRYTGPLSGVCLAVKDTIMTKNLRTTCGSRMLSDYVPTYSSTAVELLEKAGAVILGKTNCDEFAMGSTTETSYFGPTMNPLAPGHVPGGSSGGSAAAVAAGIVNGALGSDTGGSIREPAAYCGVTGLKPTYGTVSRYGLVAYASSMDQIGPIGVDVSDTAVLLETIAAYDPKDATSRKREDTDFTRDLVTGVEGLKIGIPDFESYAVDNSSLTDPAVLEKVLSCAHALEEAGAAVETFEFDRLSYAVPAYYVIACAEAFSNLSRFDGVRYGYRTEAPKTIQELYERTRGEGFGEETRRRIELGSFVLSSGYYDEYYLQAARVRRLIRDAFDEALARFDVILMPTAPKTAPRLNESLKDPIRMYEGDAYTVPANLAGLPAISFPCGMIGDLPVGAQLIARPFDEHTLIRTVYTYERIGA